LQKIPDSIVRDFLNAISLVDLDDNAGADGTAALADSEAEALLDGDGGDQLDLHVDVIAGHAHLNALGQIDDAGDVGGAEVELGTIVVEERSVTAALVLGQNVDLADELGVGMDGAGLARTWPRSTSFLAMPRSRQPTLSPASA
jgi:hypothetical protein